MPFTSKSQLRTCYKQKSVNPKSTWNCDEFLRATPSVCCLPERKNKTVTRSRCLLKNERIVGKIQTGPRGGRYFTIKERYGKKECTIKVYI